jgi:tetratricopeptide (TPR) repeat protein
MSRFANLEFGDESHQRSRGPGELRNESSCFAEAIAAFASGAFERALRSFATVLEFNPSNTAAWCGQVRMLVELGEFQEASRWADKALEKFPRDAELLAAKAVAVARLGDTKAALAFSDAAVEEQGNAAYVWLSRGDVMLARQEKRADYCFEKARLLAPRDWLVQWLAARIHLYYEKFALALKHAQQALALDAAQHVVWLELGRCQKSLGMLALAQTSFEQALQLDPNCREADHALAELRNVSWLDSLRARLNGLFSR